MIIGKLRKLTRLIPVILILIGLGTGTLRAGAADKLTPGRRVSVALNDPGAGGKIGWVASFTGDSLSICSRGDMRIDRITTIDSATYSFPITGATYDGADKVASGKTTDGMQVSLKLEEIHSADVTMFVKDRVIHATFAQPTFHTRLRHQVKYPRLVWEGPVESIQALKVWRPTNRTGIVLCALTGLSLGFLHGYTQAEDDPEPDSWNLYDLKVSRDTKIALRSLLGLAVGAGIGKLIFRGRWVSVPVDQLHARLMPATPNGPGLTVAIGF